MVPNTPDTDTNTLSVPNTLNRTSLRVRLIILTIINRCSVNQVPVRGSVSLLDSSYSLPIYEFTMNANVFVQCPEMSCSELALKLLNKTEFKLERNEEEV